MKRRAFTLIELLIVIGIIALMIALLLPTLSAANAQSKNVQCLSNLRQLSLAAEQYCNGNGGYYPIAFYGDSRPPLSISYTWYVTTITNSLTHTVTTQPGLLWPGMTASPVQQCPALDSSDTSAGNLFTGYNYNVSYIGGGKSITTIAPAKAAQVRHPSRCALFGDAWYYGGADNYMRSPFPGPLDGPFSSPAAGTQSFRHRGKTNVVFCDGHADTLSTRYTQSSDTHAVAAATGFLSADNSMYDLR